MVIASLACGEVSEHFDRTGWRHSEFADYHVVHRAQRGDNPATEFLLSKYKSLVCNKARSYFLVGAESDDLVQVGMLGLWQAITDFRAEHAVPFHSFAKVCIVNHMISAVQTATRFKQNPLNQSVSLESPVESTSADVILVDVLPAESHSNPEESLIAREDTVMLKTKLYELLSEFEWLVLNNYRMGKSYSEIANALSCNTKSVDNALSRIKHKVARVPIGFADLNAIA